ncbi:MAG: helix-turn-helix domain-containing protein [Anaerolineae bacterium]
MRLRWAARKRRYVPGGHAGAKDKPWRIDPGRDGLGFFPPEVRAQATAVACSRPQAEGVPLARWSYAEIAQRLVTLRVVVAIATSTIWRWLQAEQIKPWRYHAWQHVRDPRFLELAKPVLRLYELAQVLYQQGCVGGVHR